MVPFSSPALWFIGTTQGMVQYDAPIGYTAEKSRRGGILEEMNTFCVHVRSIPDYWRDGDLQQIFEPFGPIRRATVVLLHKCGFV